MGDGTFGSRLLIVDDEPSIGRPIKRVGKGSGFEAVVAEDPGGLAGMARSWHPTVIIITLKTPGIDGIQLLRDLAADKCDAHIVVASGADGKVLEAARPLDRERGLKMSGVFQSRSVSRPWESCSRRYRSLGSRRSSAGVIPYTG